MYSSLYYITTKMLTTRAKTSSVSSIVLSNHHGFVTVHGMENSSCASMKQESIMILHKSSTSFLCLMNLHLIYDLVYSAITNINMLKFTRLQTMTKKLLVR